jgi:xanthine dehydrogenase YagR molybdenum-binding subunit
MVPYIGTPTSRIDGRAKVTGAAKYAAEFNAPALAHGAVVTATIAKGRIARIDAGEALRVDGVIDVLTHENRPRLARAKRAYSDDVAPEGSPFRPLYDDKIVFSGQPIALVLAEEWEIARFAATLVRVEYEETPHVTDLHRQRNEAFAVKGRTKARGKADKAIAAAERRHEAEYYIPMEHHNPMELFASTVTWDGGGKLTVYDKTQGVQNVQRYLCSVFNMRSDDIRVVSLFVGGAFGSGLRPQYNVTLAVLGALVLRRSVRLALTRQQMYALCYRPGTIERVALGAKADGTLAAIGHEAIAMTSQYEDFARNDTTWSSALYRCAHAKYAHKLVRLDLPTPADMRAPGGATGVYALECAMDELAVALELDPLELRLRAYSDRDQNEGVPYTSKELRECYRPAAARDARRQRADRLGHGDRHLGSDADEGDGTHRADGERPCGSRVCDIGYRDRHLHDHGTGGRRFARLAARGCHGEARRFDAAAIPSRGRLMDGGLGRQRDRVDVRGDAQRAAASGKEAAELAARRDGRRRCRACRREHRQQARCKPRRIDRGHDAA